MRRCSSQDHFWSVVCGCFSTCHSFLRLNWVVKYEQVPADIAFVYIYLSDLLTRPCDSPRFNGQLKSARDVREALCVGVEKFVIELI